VLFGRFSFLLNSDRVKPFRELAKSSNRFIARSTAGCLECCIPGSTAASVASTFLIVAVPITVVTVTLRNEAVNPNKA
jgi:hypothetical protein